MTLNTSGTLTAYANIQYPFDLLCGKALREFETLYDNVGNKTTMQLNQNLMFRYIVFFPIGPLSKQKRVVRCGTRKPHGLKVRHYEDHIIELNEYLDIFPGEEVNEKVERRN